MTQQQRVLDTFLDEEQSEASITGQVIVRIEDMDKYAARIYSAVSPPVKMSHSQGMSSADKILGTRNPRPRAEQDCNRVLKRGSATRPEPDGLYRDNNSLRKNATRLALTPL